MLVTTKEMLLAAQRGSYGVGAFNVENMEMVMAVLAAAEEQKSPVIMQTTPGRITIWQMYGLQLRGRRFLLQCILIMEIAFRWQWLHFAQATHPL